MTYFSGKFHSTVFNGDYHYIMNVQTGRCVMVVEAGYSECVDVMLDEGDNSIQILHRPTFNSFIVTEYEKPYDNFRMVCVTTTRLISMIKAYLDKPKTIASNNK